MVEYGCFRCGHHQEMDYDYGIIGCPSCKAFAMMTFQTSLDVLNDLHLKGEYFPVVENDDEIDDIVRELDNNWSVDG